MKVVFDTHAWMEYFLGSSQGSIVERHFAEEIITPFIVLLELGYRADQEGWNFQQHLDFIKSKSRIARVSEEFIVAFGKLYNQTKEKIKGFGLADAIVLRTAEMEHASILTGDEHFKEFPKVIFLR